MMLPEKSAPQAQSWHSRLRRRIEWFVSGRAPSDPLYLTNRSWAQKLKMAGLIAVPLLMVGALVMVGATDMFRLSTVDPYQHPLTEAQPVPETKRTPDPKLIRTDLEVLNIRIARDENPRVVTGIVRNNTNRNVGSAEVSFDLADDSGSLMGTETTQVQNVGPHSTVTFRAPVKTENAEHVLVHDVHSN